MIRLQHTEYATKAMGDCNDGEISASSVGFSADYYTSILTVMITQEMINGTIQCTHRNTQGRTAVIGESVLRISQGNCYTSLVLAIYIFFFFFFQLNFSAVSTA